jgi:hypothetical protein
MENVRAALASAQTKLKGNAVLQETGEESEKMKLVS